MDEDPGQIASSSVDPHEVDTGVPAEGARSHNLAPDPRLVLIRTLLVAITASLTALTTAMAAAVIRGPTWLGPMAVGFIGSALLIFTFLLVATIRALLRSQVLENVIPPGQRRPAHQGGSSG